MLGLSVAHRLRAICLLGVSFSVSCSLLHIGLSGRGRGSDIVEIFVLVAGAVSAAVVSMSAASSSSSERAGWSKRPKGSKRRASAWGTTPSSSATPTESTRSRPSVEALRTKVEAVLGVVGMVYADAGGR